MINRRRFLGSLTAAGLAGVATPDLGRGQNQWGAETGVPTLVNGSVQVTGSVVLPPPEESGIEHVVVVTMENRSFDHFLGWLAGADGLPPGLMYTDRKGVSHPSHPLASDFTGCPHPSPDHSYDQSRVAYDDGKMDGFLRAGSNDEYAIGYYTQADIPFYSALAQNYLACDRYFASILGPTFPNRLFQWAAQTDRLDDSVTFSSLPTILDRLSEAGVSHRYFFTMSPSWRCGV